MLRVIFYRLEARRMREFRELEAQLRSQGVECRELPDRFEQNRFNREDFAVPADPGREAQQKQEVLFLTDAPAVCRFAARFGIACVGVQDLDGPFFEGTELVVTELAKLDAQYLAEFLTRFHGKPVVIAQTGRLILREMIWEDAKELYRISRSSGMELARAPECGTETGFEPERLRAYIREQYRLYGYGLWSVAALPEKEEIRQEAGLPESKEQQGAALPGSKEQQGAALPEGPILGCCGFSELEASGEQDGPALEFSYMLDAPCRGRGLGREMCEAALQYAYERLEAEEIWVRVAPEHVQGLRFAQHLGFQREARRMADEGNSAVWLRHRRI